MKEKIILAPGCNGTELMRTLAKYGVNSLGIRIMNAVELATTALFTSGVSIKENFIPRKEEPALYDSFIRDIPYFKTASFSDAEDIAAAIYSLRSLIAEDEENIILTSLPKGEFTDKNAALCDVYKHFIDETEKLGMIDSISLVRKAIDKAKELEAEFCEIEEYPLSVLERELLRKLSGNKYKKISLTELFGADAKDSSNPAVLTQAYGASNEVEDILGYIYENDIPIDKCTVAVTDTGKYSQLFYDYAKQYGIKLTMGSGVPILNSNPARLLRAYAKWTGNEFFGPKDLGDVIFSESFDRKRLQDLLGGISARKLREVITVAGNLRISRDKIENNRKILTLQKVYESQLAENDIASREKDEITAKLESLKLTEKLAGELEKDYADFIRTYAVIRQEHEGRIDRSALNVITEFLDAYFKYSDRGTITEAAETIFRKSVCSENSREGCLYITGLAGAMAGMREHLFIAGMSNDVFPGSPAENYLLLDDDYLLFAGKPEAPTSDQIIMNRIDSYKKLRRLADALGTEVRLSYSCYDLADLKDKNVSSVITEKASRKTGFFDTEISGIVHVGRSYVEGKDITYSEAIKEDLPASVRTDGEYSPSAIEDFFKCPRKYMLTRILGLENPEEEDPFMVIDARQLGTLTHSLMKYLTKGGIKKSEFLARADRCFDEFEAEYVPLHKDAAAVERKRFKDLVASAFDDDPKNQVILAEERVKAEHKESGITVSGYPDRVEKNNDGAFIIADFKTGRKIDHVENDIDTCIQVLIYAYIMNESGIPVTCGEYRYLRKNEKVSCKFDDDMKTKLAGKLQQFKDALMNADFPCTLDAEVCKYCNLGSLCGKNETVEETEEEDE